MLKKVIPILVLLIFSFSQAGATTQVPASHGESCPEGYVSVVSLEPIQDGKTSSKIVGQECRPNEEMVIIETLEPLSPGEWEAVRPLEEWESQGEAVNGIVHGPSDEAEYRCVVWLEPIQPGEQISETSEPICAKGPIETINGVSLESNFLIAKFYNRTNDASLLIEYYGAQACSSQISYGVGDLPDDLDNKFASGQAFSNCDHIDVYDFNYHTGATYSCGANCPSFYALNDAVSSWRASD